MINREIADILNEAADILEFNGVEWKPRAYRRAARKIEDLSEDIRNIYRKSGKKGLEDIPGVGSGIANHIIEYLETGRVEKFERLKEESPGGTGELVEIRGLGPKKVKKLVEELNIKTVSDLREAVEEHEIRELEGFGEKTEENILKSIILFEKSHERMLLGKAMGLAEDVLFYMQENSELEKIDYAGSLRRMKETIGDIDMLVISSDPENVMKTFVNMEDADRVESRGLTRSTVILRGGIHVDLRVVPAESYGAAMQYFTGSKDHNIAMRDLAISKGYKLSEYGLFRKDSGKMVEGADEKSIYSRLGLQYIPPELRENRGEIAAAGKNELPELLELGDIRGDLHIHTTFSEGSDSLEEMVKAAENMGYEYIAITDHSRSQRIASGMQIDELRQQWEEIDRVAGEYDIRILKGAEVDILKDGSLDYPDDILAELDIVVGSVHSGFKSPKEEMTERIVAALEHRYMDILGHPSGRLIGKRESYEADFDTVFETAVNNGKILEINAHPERLDLNDRLILKAKEYGVKFSINTDSHSTSNLSFMKFGVGQARRGWLTKDDDINTYSYDRLRQLLEDIRKRK
ncbi:DNA polymerase/3'-5' exonuclease PolX [Methanolobus zinderi]|jgi:DNA polymerase (family 10)|uniref:DNA polymerase beta n=1 Tax=Methanolobus zinderi TaxID=536044 RepID=A0A7D5IBK2_9EURY|nr:DNA polymerase/3'-5' exonuclease PolX [Methanolobus zinderi]QLC49889.1 DNA polymerase/3'-5' exonuclease PolX [Methanolobus zinderi]